MELCLARPGDGDAALEIYGQYIATDVTFEYELPGQEEFAQRIAQVLSQGYPYLVCREGKRLLGYAYAHRAWERAAYQWGAELSVYLRPQSRRLGLGRQLYLALMELLQLQGVRTVYGVVTGNNTASLGFHQALGFHLAGTFTHAGYKNGHWLDVSWFEKALSPHGGPPGPVLALGQLPREQVDQVLRAFSRPGAPAEEIHG